MNTCPLCEGTTPARSHAREPICAVCKVPMRAPKPKLTGPPCREPLWSDDGFRGNPYYTDVGVNRTYDELVAAGWDPLDAHTAIRNPTFVWREHNCGAVWLGAPDSPCRDCEDERQRQDALNFLMDMDLG